MDRPAGPGADTSGELGNNPRNPANIDLGYQAYDRYYRRPLF